MTSATHKKDVTALLTEDHREVEELFARLEQLAGSDSHEAKQLADRAVIELVRHTVAEERYLYPAFRQYLDAGDVIADHEIAEHAEAELTMKRLESLQPDHNEFWPTVHELIREMRHHIHEEENTSFPRLRDAVDIDTLRELGTKVEMAKAVAPTRPHPDAPDTPRWDTWLGPGVGLVDRVRDTLSHRGT